MELYRCANCMGELKKGEQICHHCGYDIADYVQPPNALRYETILNGRYLVGRVMGQGGFGITYVGYDLVLELKVAIKEYFPSALASRSISQSRAVQWRFSGSEYQNWNQNVENFLGEARKMARLDEVPGIVRVRDCFRENQTAYIVMDFAEGTTLREYLEMRGRMDYVSCLKLLLPIMESLETMHEKGLIHRDISPDNLMVQKKDRELSAKLLDFGAAADISIDSGGAAQSIVKKGYSAPEQYLENSRTGSWSDVYAMAAVIYRCVTGTEIPEAIERVLNPAEISMKGVSNKEAREILANALAVETEERIGTMAEFRRALENTLPSRKRAGRTVLAVAALLAACGVGAGVLAFKPWLPEVEALGCSNANRYQGANYATIEGEYEYFADEEWNLYICPFDKEDRTFYVDRCILADSESGFINIGSHKVYFIHDNAENPGEEDSIIEMDFDGSNRREVVSSSYYNHLQYARLSSGKEMLYYLKENGDEEDGLFSLYRYDLDAGREEKLLDEDVFWYNLDGRYIYYTTFESGNLSKGIFLKRAYLSGKGARLLNDRDALFSGYIENGTMYLVSFTGSRLEICDLEGNVKENPLGESASAMFYGCHLYDQGWIYYSTPDSGELRKIRPDGTGETVIFTGENVLELGVSGGYIWFVTGDYEAETSEVQLDHAYLMYSDGTGLLALGGYETENGLRYKVKDGEVILTGYMGENDYVVVPKTFYEGEWKGQVAESFPGEVDLYTMTEEEELTWETLEDGTGLELTGYSGEQTGTEHLLALPGEIGGKAVRAVGEGFMKGNKTIAGIVFPEGLEQIDREAFNGCSQLKAVALPKSLKGIGSLAFFGAPVEHLRIPASLETCSPSAFYGIKTLEADGKNQTFKVEGNVLYSGERLLLIGAENTGDFLVPEDISEISAYAGVNSRINSVVMSGNVKRIGNHSFYNAQALRKAVISEGTEEIGWGAFGNCISLEEVRIPKTVKRIESIAFGGCSSLKSVTVSRDCQIAEDAFDEGVQIQYYEDR